MPKVRVYDTIEDDEFLYLEWLAKIVTSRHHAYLTSSFRHLSSLPSGASISDADLVNWCKHVKVMEITKIPPSELTGPELVINQGENLWFKTREKILHDIVPDLPDTEKYKRVCSKVRSIMAIWVHEETKRRKGTESGITHESSQNVPSLIPKKKNKTNLELREGLEKATAKHSVGVQDELFSTRQMTGGVTGPPITTLPPQTSIEERHEYQPRVNLIFPEIDWEAGNQQKLNAHKYPKPKRFGRKQRICR